MNSLHFDLFRYNCKKENKSLKNIISTDKLHVMNYLIVCRDVFEYIEQQCSSREKIQQNV